MTDPGPHDPSAVTVFFGRILMAVGGVIALSCGLCTVSFAGWGLWSAFQPDGPGYGWAMAIVALKIGVVPTGVGVGIVVVGRDLARPRGRANAGKERP